MENIDTPTSPIQLDYYKDQASYSQISHHITRKNSTSPLTPLMRDHRDLAAVKLQKVYKSFRTRRRLADCAVLAEQKWYHCSLIFLNFQC